MSVELSELGTEDLLSRTSDTLNPHDMKLRMHEIKENVVSFVDEKCKLHGQKSLRIPCSQYSEEESVLSILISKEKGVYEVGLELPFSVHYVNFKHNKFLRLFRFEEDDDLNLRLITKENCPTEMKYNYADHPNVTFDGLVKIFSTVCEISERMDEDSE
jgi:hypothetical protein